MSSHGTKRTPQNRPNGVFLRRHDTTMSTKFVCIMNTALLRHDLAQSSIMIHSSLLFSSTHTRHYSMLWKTLTLLLFFTVTVYSRSVLDVLENDKRFETFVGYLKKNDMIRDIEDMETATVFAPINEAFGERREEDELTYTLFGRRVTRGQLLYHILPNAVKTKELHENELFETRYEQALTPQRIKIGRDNDKITVNNAQIVEGDIDAEKAVIHAMDDLLTPPKDLGKLRYMIGLFIYLTRMIYISQNPEAG